MTKPVTPPVSDHAVLRYMQRVLGFDVEGLRVQIWTTCAPAVQMGATCLRADGVRYEFVNGRITTVVPDGPTPSLTSRARTQNRMARR